MFLVDTNVFLEVFLEQQRAEESREFLLNAPADSLYINRMPSTQTQLLQPLQSNGAIAFSSQQAIAPSHSPSSTAPKAFSLVF